MSRRCLCAVLALAVLCCLAGCTSFSAPQSQVWLDVFDTVTTLTVYGYEGDFEALAEQVHQRLTDYHRLFDIYHTYEGITNLKTVNDAAGTPVAVTEPLLDLLAYGKAAYEQTNGRVNVAFGAVLRLWHEGRQTEAVPSATALQAAAAHTGIDVLVIDRKAGTVCLTDPAASLDVGAVAKGYAAELVADYLKELGVTSALLDVGGNIRAVGDKGGKPFIIGVKKPDVDSAAAYLLTMGLSDCAAVTSGDYQRYFMADGKRYAHIIDPDTLQPAAYVRAVTVVCPDSGRADVLSTALFTLPPEEGERLLERYPDAEAVWVLADGTQRYSDGFEALIS